METFQEIMFKFPSQYCIKRKYEGCPQGETKTNEIEFECHKSNCKSKMEGLDRLFINTEALKGLPISPSFENIK